MKQPELLLPAGSLEKMRTAYAFGADAVYAGQPRYSLRARNNEFKLDQLETGIAEAHALGKKFFVASNLMPHNAKVKTYLADMEPVIAMNPGASLVDLGDGVACVELHTKMNTLDDDIFTMILQGLDRTDQDFEALVISTDGENFSAGANLMMIVMGAQSAMWDQLDTMVRKS